MIDLIVLQFQHSHRPFGNERIKRIDGSTATTSKRFSKTISLQICGSPITVTSLQNGTRIEVRCCPLKPLQGHNVFGTDNLCSIAGKLIPAVLDKLKIAYQKADVDAWSKGAFSVEALDITQRFCLPENTTAKSICEHLLRNSSSKFRPAWLKAGDGLRLEVPRSNSVWLIYDKALELQDKRTHALKHLAAVHGESANVVWKNICETASKSIRVELKLSKDYLRQHDLLQGNCWSISRTINVFFMELERLRFERFVPLNQLKTSVTAITQLSLRRVLDLWECGAPLEKRFPESTLSSQRSAIRNAIGIDILLDRPIIDLLPIPAIFSRCNMLKPFPKWVSQHRNAGFGCGRPRNRLHVQSAAT